MCSAANVVVINREELQELWGAGVGGVAEGIISHQCLFVNM